MVVPPGYLVSRESGDLHKRVLQFAEKNGTTYDQALSAVANLEGE